MFCNVSDIGVQVGALGDVFGQHAVNEDEDFVRVFPTPTSMVYLSSGGERRTKKLNAQQLDTLKSFGQSRARPRMASVSYFCSTSFVNDQQLPASPTHAPEVVPAFDGEMQYA